MKQNTQLETIENITKQDFYDNYFTKLKPIVIKNVTRTDIQDPNRNINWLKDKIGNNKFTVVEEISHRYIEENKEPVIYDDWTLNHFMERLKNYSNHMLGIIEFNPPKVLNELVPVPDICYTDSSNEVYTWFYYGNAGNVAGMHFDTDQNDALMVQLAGRKKIYLVEPSQAKKLFPILNQSLFNIKELSDSEKQDLFSYCNAQEYILEPGEALYMPMMIWHHVEYLEPAISVVFRFGRNKINKFLANNIHPDFYMQSIARLFHRNESSVDTIKYFEIIKKALVVDIKSPEEKYKYMRTVLREIYEKLYNDKDYFITNIDRIIDNSKKLTQVACSIYHS
jgi:ribosomal protein L16 Arg81 hydroxylase